MEQLRLEARDVAGPLRWRWLLTDQATGTPLADHQVTLDDPAAEPDVRAFDDLYAYLRWNAEPDRRPRSEAMIVNRLGEWAAGAVLGPVAGAIAAAAPVTVRVTVPEQAAFLLSWPLELAHAGGRPLAARGDVTFAYDLPVPGGPARPAEAGPALRMLAVFSLPSRTSVLALRRERY